jgi:hypothetical protein
MKIVVENHDIECFENEIDYNNWIKEMYKNPEPLYHGSIFGIPENIKNLFNGSLPATIRKINYNNTEYIAIWKK